MLLATLALGAAGCLAQSPRTLIEDAAALDAEGPDGGLGDGDVTDGEPEGDVAAPDAGSRDALAPDLGPDGGLPTYFWWSDVQPIVAARCLMCHGNPPTHGAGVPIVTYEDTQRPALPSHQPVHILMASRVAQHLDPPLTAPQLTPNEIQRIVYWSAIGAPEGTRPDSGVLPDAQPRDAQAADASADAQATDAQATDASDGGLPDV